MKNSQCCENQKRSTNWGITYLIGHLYLLQGFAFGFFCSMPLTYEEVPNYQVLSMFDSAALPFSFKFLLAPILERYTSQTYGKRKTWIVITIFASGILHFFLSFVVGIENYQVTAATILFFCTLATALKDVGSDALAVQQIQHTPTISIASFAGQEIGKAITLSLFLALISKNYWLDYGFDGPIMQASTFMRVIVVFIFLTGFSIHFFYKQKEQLLQHSEDQKEEQFVKQSFWKILEHYRHFLLPKYQLFRQGLVILLMNHGILYFTSTYSIQLIKKGVERQTLMFIENISFIPNIFVSILLSKYLNPNNMHTYQHKVAIAQFLFVFFLYLANINNYECILIVFTWMYVIGSVHYFLETAIINQMSKGRYSGITVTVLLSISNFSRNTAIHKELIHIYAYQNCVLFGLFYAGLVITVLSFANDWIKRGEPIDRLKIE